MQQSKIQIQIQRAQILNFIRDFFQKKGFLEVQTPILTKNSSTEPYLDPVPVKFSDDKHRVYQGYLITSPEYSLKKLLSLGFQNIFEITKAFRQKEAFGGWHNPEFTILEWYRTKADYCQIMKDTEELICGLVKKLYRRPYFFYQKQEINVSQPWLKISVKQAFQKYAQINLDKAKNFQQFKALAGKKKYHINPLSSGEAGWNDLFYLIFLNEIEPQLPKDRPVILYDYPLAQAALAKRKNKKSFYAERFEVYIAGVEICNAFSELLDWKEQLKRLKEDQKIRKKLKKEIISIDKSFIQALKSGILPTAGNALGIERLEMLLLDIKDIDELLTFPASKLFH